MPIFEEGEPITAESFARQQKELNEKVFRKQEAELWDNPNVSGESFDGGDLPYTLPKDDPRWEKK